MRYLVAAPVCVVVAASLSGCTAGTRNDPPPVDESALSRAADDAVALLAKAPLEGYAREPVASGHNRADDEGREVSEEVKGRALFQIACSGTGKLTVTLPAEHRSRLVHCGRPATDIPFRGSLTALVVGQRDTTGAYAWRILAATR